LAGVALAVLVGLAAVIAPISTSLYLARRESLSAEQKQALSYANDVMRRTHETRDEFQNALDEIAHDGLAPCSPPEITLMRQLDLSSSYLQAVGRVQGNRLICTSLGTTQPIDLGPPTLTTENGVDERYNVHLSIDPSLSLSVASRNGLAILVDPRLLVDTPTEGRDISISVFTASNPSRGPLASTGKPLPAAWLHPIAKGEHRTSIEGGTIVSTVRSADSDFEVVVAIPELYARRHVRKFAAIFVPLGLLCGMGLVWAVIYISRQRSSLPTLLRAAARRKEFYVEYQPIVDMESGRWIGAEALVRWKRNGRSMRPDLFIPTAEESGVITLITERVAAIIAADLPKLLQIDSAFQVGINLSVADLRSPKTLELLLQTLAHAGANAANLEIEATERGFLQGKESRDLIDQVRNLGISVAIDDFGTGYSSLACLQTLGLDTLKIDKTFVETIGTDGATSQVVPHIIDMAHSLGLEMIAEGVETETQVSFLKSRGVQYAQGWYFAKAMSLSALCESLQSRAANRSTGA
jgi:sensor c-di-GMP phosphodiesterase-like protein